MGDDAGHSTGTGDRPSLPDLLDLLAGADRRLVRTVDALDDEEYAAPSGLPGWSRAHVVAHLALNAEALAGVVEGLARDRQVPMYDSPQARDDDIDELAAAGAAQLRERLLGATRRFAEAAAALPEDRWVGEVERTPGGPRFPAHQVVGKRLTEVEVHHADLAAGYTPADWPTSFAVTLVDSMRSRTWASGFRVLARDVARTWELGPDAGSGHGPTVAGDSHALAWWLTGRGDGSDLTVDRGPLPEVDTW